MKFWRKVRIIRHALSHPFCQKIHCSLTIFPRTLVWKTSLAQRILQVTHQIVRLKDKLVHVYDIRNKSFLNWKLRQPSAKILLWQMITVQSIQPTKEDLHSIGRSREFWNKMLKCVKLTDLCGSKVHIRRFVMGRQCVYKYGVLSQGWDFDPISDSVK